MVRRKFLRSKWRTASKLGKGRKKKQKWRKPKGRDTQMRLQKKGNPRIVKVGYKKQKKKVEKVEVIKNINELLKTKSKEIIIGKIGNKKKIEIIKKVIKLHKKETIIRKYRFAPCPLDMIYAINPKRICIITAGNST